jgi:hypothetical protein
VQPPNGYRDTMKTYRVDFYLGESPVTTTANANEAEAVELVRAKWGPVEIIDVLVMSNDDHHRRA